MTEEDSCEPYIMVTGRPIEEIVSTVMASGSFLIGLPGSDQLVIVETKAFIKAVKELSNHG